MSPILYTKKLNNPTDHRKSLLLHSIVQSKALVSDCISKFLKIEATESLVNNKKVHVPNTCDAHVFCMS